MDGGNADSFVMPPPARPADFGPLYAVLPNRRIAAIETVEWRPGVSAFLSVGFDSGGAVREMFASLVKPTQWLDLSFADTARFLSHLLQEGGFSLAALIEKLSATEPEPDGVAKPSVPRWLLEHARRIELAEGPRVAGIHREFPGSGRAGRN